MFLKIGIKVYFVLIIGKVIDIDILLSIVGGQSVLNKTLSFKQYFVGYIRRYFKAKLFIDKIKDGFLYSTQELLQPYLS